MSIIPYGKHYIDKEDIDNVVKVLKSNNLTQGPIIEIFEKKFAKYVGAKYAVAVSSCTAGLHLCSQVFGLNNKNYLLTSPITFVSTSNAAFYCGSAPVFADISKNDINISVECLKNELKKNKKIKIVSPVHFGGNPCDMEIIYKICKKIKGIKIVEDAAHALGAKYKDGSFVGSCKYSDATVFSMHPVKIIASGEGGVVTTNDYKTYKNLIRLRSHGINKKDDTFLNKKNSKSGNIFNPWYYEMQDLGYHYRITDIQCSLALSQLKKINKFLNKRRKIVKLYDSCFKNSKIIEIGQKEKKLSSHHLYIIRINFKKYNKTRAELMNFLKSKNIITQVHYIPVTHHPFYSNKKFNSKNFPQALNYYDETLSLPIYYSLTEKQQKFVIKNLINFFK